MITKRTEDTLREMSAQLDRLTEDQTLNPDVVLFMIDALQLIRYLSHVVENYVLKSLDE